MKKIQEIQIRQSAIEKLSDEKKTNRKRGQIEMCRVFTLNDHDRRLLAMRFFSFVFFTAGSFGASSVHAFGDFPLASCTAFNGTIVEKIGVNTDKAMMKGIVTRADIQEYCERDPGLMTREKGGKLTVNQCVEQIYRSEKDVDLLSTANCVAKTLRFRYNGNSVRAIKFPLPPGADISCASGKLPLMSQFVILCPDAANRLGIE